MKRLLSTIFWDIRLQWRYGFYMAGLFVAIIMMVLVSLVPADILNVLLPPFLIFNMIITTFFFMAGLVLLEKGQETLAGLVVTPLRQGEYLTAKVISLTILVLIESILIVGVGYGLDLNWLWLLLGLVLMAPTYTLLGFVFTSRYESINELIIPSMLPMLVLALPLIDYFGLWESPLFYLIPTQGPLTLITAAFQIVPVWDIPVAITASLLWLGISFLWSRQRFDRFIRQNAG
jgi:fluoroquinolone transport system permease protein